MRELFDIIAEILESLGQYLSQFGNLPDIF